MISYTLGKVSFTLRAPFNFSFLRAYGEPFCVFDQQDSGNLCFGVAGAQGERFLKLAGAATVRGSIPPQEAVRRLLGTLPTYEALAHPALLPILGHQAVPGGHVLVFEWFDGRCMGKQYDAHGAFLALPLWEKLALYEVVLDFHRHVNERGYVAIDFYDGAIMYDFATRQTRLCDIEFYRKMPYVNGMGRLWGSTRYMAPEEFTLGAAIDARTNVFCMGATAFCLMGGEMDRSRAKWQAGDALYAVAERAVRPDRADRYASIAAYQAAWHAAL